MDIKSVNQQEEESSGEEAPINWVLNVRDLPEEGILGEREAKADELRSLSERLNDEHDLQVKSLRCSYHVSPKKTAGKNGFEECVGVFHLVAELRQTCVVTLERIDTVVEEEFSLEFTSASARSLARNAESELLDDPFDREPPISVVKGNVELGPFVYQYFSMAIDTNPRKPGACFKEELKGGCEHEELPPSPFAALEKYKHKK